MTTIRDRDRVLAPGATALTPVPESLRRELQALGLRPYAARLVLALLRAGSGNSAELAELSGVPRTSIYQVMAALTEQGLAVAVPTRGVAVWTCPPWDVLVDVLDAAEEERLRDHHARTTRLRHDLATIFPTPSSMTA